MTDAAVLWDWLDAHGVPFRLTGAELARRFGARPSGVAGGAVQLAPDRPLFGMATELTAFYVEPDICSTELVAGLRPGTEAKGNLDTVVRAISAEFGAGENASASNTIGRRWTFGRASVEATVWPPELNPGPNARHAADPGAVSECRLVIAPAWQPPVSAADLAAIAAMRPVGWVPEAGPFNAPRMAVWPDELGPFRGGIGPAPDGALIIAARPGLCRIVAAARLVRITHHRATPARGPGWAAVSVEYLEGPPLSLLCRSGSGDLLTEARALAAALALPLHSSETTDD